MASKKSTKKKDPYFKDMNEYLDSAFKPVKTFKESIKVLDRLMAHSEAYDTK